MKAKPLLFIALYTLMGVIAGFIDLSIGKNSAVAFFVGALAIFCICAVLRHHLRIALFWYACGEFVTVLILYYG